MWPDLSHPGWHAPAGRIGQSAGHSGGRVAAPGRTRVKCRILASELATPIEHMVELRIDGQSQHIQDEYLLRAAIQDPFVAALVSPKK